MSLPFQGTCVGCPDVPALVAMIDDSREITRRTFLRHVNRADFAELESQLGYSRSGLHMANDWHVTYHRSKWRGRTCYFFQHSLIEHYFYA